MTTEPLRRATLADLVNTEGKAELINGRIITFPFNCVQEGRQKMKILRSLERYVSETGIGEACTGGMGFVLPEPLPSGRQSFCPDLSYLAEQPRLHESGFVLGVPTFAVEFISRYGPVDYDWRQRIADYFAAGTSVVWEVRGWDAYIECHRRDSRKIQPFNCGDIADAEPAVPGWRFRVNELIPYP